MSAKRNGWIDSLSVIAPVPALVVSRAFDFLPALQARKDLLVETCRLNTSQIYQAVLQRKRLGDPFLLIFLDDRQLELANLCELYQKLLQLDAHVCLVSFSSALRCHEACRAQQDQLLKTFPGRLFFYSEETRIHSLMQVVSLFVKSLVADKREAEFEQALLALKQKELDFQQSLASGVGVLTLTSECKILDANAYVTVMTGWSLSRMVNSPVESFFELDFSKTEQELQYCNHDGRYVWGSFTIIETGQGYLVLFKDSTKRKAESRIQEYHNYQDGLAQAKRELRHNVGNTVNSMASTIAQLNKSAGSMESLGQLIPKFLSENAAEESCSSYQFLRGLQGFWDLDLPAQVLEPLRVLTKDVDGLLNFFERSIVEKETQEELGEVNDLISDVILSVSAFLESQGVAIRFVDVSQAIYLKVNENELFHVFLNLIKNAAEALSERAVLEPQALKLITIQFWKISTKGLEVRVHDTAGSIAPEAISKVFKQGYTTKERGLGEGLHSVANFMRRTGGEITVVSSKEKGTEFSLVFPADRILLASRRK